MIKSMDPTVDKSLVQNLKCRGWCWITCEQKCNNDDDDDDGGDGDDGGDDFCLETFGIDEGWSAERSCFGKTSSFESPLRGLSLVMMVMMQMPMRIVMVMISDVFFIIVILMERVKHVKAEVR